MKSPVYGVPTFILSRIGDVAVDAMTSVTVTYPNRITQHPVEDGGVISDHVIALPVRIEIEGRLVDSPVFAGVSGVVGAAGGALAAASSFLPVPAIVAKGVAAVATGADFIANIVDNGLFAVLPGRAKAQFKILRTLRDDRTPFAVALDLDTYDNCVFEELSQPSVAKDGRSIRFTAIIQQVIVSQSLIVSADTVTPAVSHSATQPVNKGIVPVGVL